MVVYCLKFVLRGESPRDYADFLRSLKFPPSISICDIPDRLARHVNNTLPGFFSPHDGMLFPVNDDNLLAAEQGLLKKSLPWVLDDVASSFTKSSDSKSQIDDIHPITGVIHRYCLFDRFHERNSSQRSSLLRRVTLVPELHGLINTGVEEQLHSSIGRSNYCLNTMKPSHHLFMMRLKIHQHNNEINATFKRRIENTFSAQAGHQVKTTYDRHGRLVLRQGNAGFLQDICGEHRSSRVASPFTSAAVNPISSPVHEGSPAEIDLPLSPVIPVTGSREKVASTDLDKKREVSTSPATDTPVLPTCSAPDGDHSSASTTQAAKSGPENVKVRHIIQSNLV